jgi:hypothetical protein
MLRMLRWVVNLNYSIIQLVYSIAARRKAVWDQKGDICDVISIGKLVRNSDGTVEVDQILSMMIKYGNKSALN